MNLTEAADAVTRLLEGTKPRRGLKAQKHAQHLGPARKRVAAVLRSYWARQEAALLKDIKPRIRQMLAIHPPLKEAITPAGARFASNLVPSSLQPLRFAVTKAEASEYADAITDAITGAGKVIAGELALGRINVEDVASTYLRDNSLSKLTGEIAAETTKRLQDGLAQAWDRGGSYDQMVAAVKDTFKDFSDTRAGMIAQTETNDAYNEARDKIATDAGMNEKAWETESGDPCPTCVENEDAGYIDIDEDFPSGDDAPTAHPNCMCSLKYRKSS